MCLRARNTERYLKIVGEVRHGFATGHVWECVDEDDCQRVAIKKLTTHGTGVVNKARIEVAQKIGRSKEYKIFN